MRWSTTTQGDLDAGARGQREEGGWSWRCRQRGEGHDEGARVGGPEGRARGGQHRGEGVMGADRGSARPTELAVH